MPNPTVPYRRSFQENIETLFEELDLAVKWERPSILLAVQKSKLGQNKAAGALEMRLKAIGQTVQPIVVDNEEPDVPHRILNAANLDHTVFFVSNIDWGGGEDGKDAYRALNMYREFFVENRVRAVFWLTGNEAANLPRHAPDFWAFRHRVIEFISPRSARDILPAGALLWHAQSSIATHDSPEDGIHARQEILARLPGNEESLSTRAELLYGIGYLYWLLGNNRHAMKTLADGTNLVGDYELPGIRAQLLNGRAIIQYEAEEYEKAFEIWKQALENQPDDGLLLINTGIVSSALGRNQEGIALGKKAVKTNQTDARLWSGLGYIYETTGKLDEALASFIKASELASIVAAPLISLAICYALIGRTDKSLQALNSARKNAGGQKSLLIEIYELAVTGHRQQATSTLKDMLSANQIQGIFVGRDPDLKALFDASDLESLTEA